MDERALLDKLTDIVCEAGALARCDRESVSEVHARCKGGNQLDLVTATDRKVEDFLLRRLPELLPGSAFFGEETGHHGDVSSAEYLWIIDPIDGTVNFSRNIPQWAISVGLYRRGEPYMGVVYAPMLNELFTAVKGGGAYLNGRRIHVSNCDNFPQAVVVTGFACLRAGWKEENNLKWFNKLAPKCLGVRRLGAASVDLAYLAMGRFDAYWEIWLAPYDYAAGRLLVTEAGGKFSDFQGGNDMEHCGILAANVEMYPLMRQEFTDYQGLHR